MPRTVARISPDVPLPPDAVFDQLCDVEKILRLNPHWICRNFAGAPAGQLRHGAEISVDVEDRLTGEIHRLRGVCSRYEPFSRLTLKYEGSTRLYTRFFIARGGEGSRITVEEVFSDKEDEEKFRWHHQQLEYWVHAIIEYPEINRPYRAQSIYCAVVDGCGLDSGHTGKPQGVCTGDQTGGHRSIFDGVLRSHCSSGMR